MAKLAFKSTSYDWLVVAGNKAMFKGEGTVNGAPGFKFQLSAIDGTPDMFRIKIWNESGTVYDNQIADADDGDPTTVLGGGSIIIHKK